MNPVVVLTHNNLELTKRCVESIRAQDIDTQIYVFDNGSTDGSVEWGRLSAVNGNFEKTSTLREFWEAGKNKGVSEGWNTILDYLFAKQHIQIEHVLVTGNDTVLPKFYYRKLLSYNLPFISGTETGELIELEVDWDDAIFENSPDFGSFLIRRDCWEKVGKFDFWSWCGDCDYHIRSHRSGITLSRANVPYYHERSSTIKNAPAKEKRVLEMQADADRITFFEKWRCLPGTPEYAKLFQ